jgi:hypothetical protein
MRKSKIARVALSALVMFHLVGCATSFSAKPISGSVVDENGKPVAGVNILAHWALSAGLEGGSSIDVMAVEAVSDAEGKFFIPGWGPKTLPAGLPLNARFSFMDPELILFKPGFYPADFSNEITGPKQHQGSVRISDWDGKTLRIRRFFGKMEDYATLVDLTLSGMNYRPCGEKSYPLMTVALIQEARRLKDQGFHRSRQNWEMFQQIWDMDKCGSVDEFFKVYVK